MRITRRDILRTGVLGAAGLTLPWTREARAAKAPPDFTAAFFTDTHVYGSLGAPEGMTAAVQHALAQPHRPELMITGGDLVMDILETGAKRADRQFELFEAAFDGVDVPVHHCIGNHDCLGVSAASGVSRKDPLWGKGYFCERFGREKTYTSFDHGGWHFVLLDSVGLRKREYVGQVDAVQLAWLQRDLAAAGKPTVVAMHIPLFTSWWEWENGTARPDPDQAIVRNCDEVARVLHRHDVKLVLGGHLHINESWTYKKIEYANIGAVSGAWWSGPREGFEEGYALLEFRGDRVSWQYVDYGWEVRG